MHRANLAQLSKHLLDCGVAQRQLDAFTTLLDDHLLRVWSYPLVSVFGSLTVYP
ncbi:hypothetical protein C791_6800 [Amycolatopsis azurea DSM 43854]|uniref:Uncharacterized protein n=1 Tax=Amycolatopsis azurea DSM 43854 TaxID=1238180 RepID=M2NNF4_9PSEU|nr:hypothetical protein C791_6800 [Amycolatopsis azurea DSM 43854]